MFSPYTALHDNYVSNRKNIGRKCKTFTLSVGCLAALGTLLFLTLREKSTHKAGDPGGVRAAGGSAAWDPEDDQLSQHPVSDGQCRIVLAESIPLYMNYDSNATFGIPMYEAWKDLLTRATNSVYVASFYWTLTDYDIGVNSSTDWLGRDIFKRFQDLPSRNVSVWVATSVPTVRNNSTDLKVLKAKGIHVRKVNFGHLTGGVLHTKLWVVDMKHIFIGSANMDWRALTQVKELGVVVYDCPHLAADLYKIFKSYWVMGRHNASVPKHWPAYFDTSINKESPLMVNISGAASAIYISASPPSFCPSTRTMDLDAILTVIQEAELFVDVAVMEYFPTSRFTKPSSYWPALDDALRQTAFAKQVAVRLLVSCGQDTDPAMLPFLKSLNDLHYPAANISIEVKVYIVPVANQSDIPFSRVNHNKYMVTDKAAYVGTSNWSADYFANTAGVGLVVSQNKPHPGRTGQTLQEQLRAAFERDWNSRYAFKLSNLGYNPECTFTNRS
ncbi:5'-3' exonuclease PLD4 [Paramormyrops kingsleyae]|uniref:Phospholipase D family member 4 n=1 Tax=Paramormyrops kingsleyae TaxID=1676925 RepID=A0A3B3RKT6_9TELE|nr:phospholipase D4-like [Paramormyrops kingsleyae]